MTKQEYIPILICSNPRRIESLGENFLINTGTCVMYPIRIMIEAVAAGLFRGCPVYHGHQKETHFLGIVTRAFWSPTAGGVAGMIQAVNQEAAETIRKGEISAFYQNKTRLLGDEFRIVERVELVYSVDVVEEAFMGGRVLTAGEYLNLFTQL